MEFKWRKWNRATHRDLGYFFIAMSLIYGLSGIALNHMDDFNPNYSLRTREQQLTGNLSSTEITKDEARGILKLFGEEGNYRKHYAPDDNKIRIFIKGGDVTVDLGQRTARMEKLVRRPVFYHVNLLHYNNVKKLWTWFSDLYAGGLIILAISGMFILKGKNGITRRGAWLTIAGLLIPLIFLFIYV